VIRAYGIDGVVLLGGCDKTTPGQLMGAASVDLPTIVVSSGPMLNGKYRGRTSGRAPTSGSSPKRCARAT
jgi:dehydratase ilvD1